MSSLRIEEEDIFKRFKVENINMNMTPMSNHTQTEFSGLTPMMKESRYESKEHNDFCAYHNISTVCHGPSDNATKGGMVDIRFSKKIDSNFFGRHKYTQYQDTDVSIYTMSISGIKSVYQGK